jgi:hypothetical protein
MTLGAVLTTVAWFLHSAYTTELPLVMRCADDSSRPAFQWVCKRNIYVLRITPEGVKQLNAMAGAYFAVRLKDKKEAEKMLAFFLSRGVDINSVDNKVTNAGLTALHHAVNANEPEEVKLLLAHGANANVLSDQNQTSLELARHLQRLYPDQDHSQVIRLLIDSGRPKYSGFVRHYN